MYVQHCFYFSDPFNLLNYAQTPPIQAQPITFKIPKKKLKECKVNTTNNISYLFHVI